MWERIHRFRILSWTLNNEGWECKRLVAAVPAGQCNRPCCHHLRLHLSCWVRWYPVSRAPSVCPCSARARLAW